jgi:hypothetical protein
MWKLPGSIAVLVVLTSVLAAGPSMGQERETGDTPQPRGEKVRSFLTEQHNPTSGMIGLHLDRPAELRQPHGISLDLGGAPVWDTCAIDYEWPDLILAYSHTLKADNLRLRADTAQMELGRRVGHPVTPFQLHITGGNDQAPLGGLALATYGWQYSLYMYNKRPGSKRTNLNFFNLFSWCTDSTATGTTDFFLRNYQTNSNPIYVSPQNDISLNGNLAHTGAKAGFYGAAPITRPVIAGSRSDGTALTNLLSKLQAMGLIVDNTTP